MSHEHVRMLIGQMNDVVARVSERIVDVQFLVAVLRDDMLTPAETQARWQAVAECEENDA